MKLKISAIGKLKSGAEGELFARYLKRAGDQAKQTGFSSVSAKEFSQSRADTAELRKRQEAEILMSCVGKGAILVGLDERGEDYSSSRFAQYLGAERDNGLSEMVFAIGGPDGLGPEILRQAKTTLRFGKMTWPHQIARILLAEQIYRAMTILAGHPYHRN